MFFLLQMFEKFYFSSHLHLENFLWDVLKLQIHLKKSGIGLVLRFSHFCVCFSKIESHEFADFI